MPDEIVDDTKPLLRAISAGSRYKDGYRTARLLSSFGILVKVVGGVAGIFVALIGFFGNNNRSEYFGTDPRNYETIGGFLLTGLMIWLTLYIIGLLLCGLGHILFACLDSAVHTSPFLTDEERVDTMALKTWEVE